MRRNQAVEECRYEIKAACSWYRKGEERIPELGNDWKTSLILKLDETTSPASSDRAINAYIADHSVEVRLISFALERHWSAFRCLDQPSKDRWCVGIHLLNIKPYAGASSGHAVHAFSWVVERALRESVFIPFKKECRGNPGLLGDVSQPAKNSEVFREFLSGKPELAFGQMLFIAKKSVVSRQTPFCSFAEWLKVNRPSYFKRIGQPEEYMMVELRNHEDHAKMEPISEADADKLLDASTEMISRMFEDRP